LFEDFRELSISFRYKLNSRFLENFANFIIILVTSSKTSVLSLLSEKYLYDLDPESLKRIRAFYLDQPEGEKQLRNDAEILNILKDVFSMAFFIQPMIQGCVSRGILAKIPSSRTAVILDLMNRINFIQERFETIISQLDIH
jgi:hypothetical protein